MLVSLHELYPLVSSAHRTSLGGLIDSYSNSGYLFREFQAEATIEISKTYEISDEQENQKKICSKNGHIIIKS